MHTYIHTHEHTHIQHYIHSEDAFHYYERCWGGEHIHVGLYDKLDQNVEVSLHVMYVFFVNIHANSDQDLMRASTQDTYACHTHLDIYDKLDQNVEVRLHVTCV